MPTAWKRFWVPAESIKGYHKPTNPAYCHPISYIVSQGLAVYFKITTRTFSYLTYLSLPPLSTGKSRTWQQYLTGQRDRIVSCASYHYGFSMNSSQYVVIGACALRQAWKGNTNLKTDAIVVHRWLETQWKWAETCCDLYLLPHNLELSLVTLNLCDLRAKLLREARDKAVLLSPHLPHSRNFDLRTEYRWWQCSRWPIRILYIICRNQYPSPS